MGVKCSWKRGRLASQSRDQLRLVGGVVVHDQMNVQVLRHGCLNGIEEGAELYRPMAGLALTNHLAAPGVQGREQRSGATAQVVMSTPFHLARTHGQQGPGPILDKGIFGAGNGWKHLDR